MTDNEIYRDLGTHILQAFDRTIELHGDTPDVRAQFFIDVATACFSAMSTIASDESVRTAAALAAEKGIETATIARQLFPAGAPKKETLQ